MNFSFKSASSLPIMRPSQTGAENQSRLSSVLHFAELVEEVIMEEAIGTTHVESSLAGTLPSGELGKAANYVYQAAIIAAALLLLLTAMI